MRDIGLYAAGAANYEVEVYLLYLLADLHLKQAILVIVLKAHVAEDFLHLLEVILKLLRVAFAVKRAGGAHRQRSLQRKAAELLD